MEPSNLNITLEGLLFVASRPLRAKELAKILELPEPQIKTALQQIMEEKKDQGIILLEAPEGYQLSTNSKISTQVKNFLNAELREKLTDATVEVLAIIAYRQPISKAEIEAIRGVNSQYSVRSLLMRGLIEKISNPSDARSFLYQTTTEFLMHLGLTSAKDLPEFEKLVSQIKLPETPALQNAQEETAPTSSPEPEPPTAQPADNEEEPDEDEEEDDEEDEE